MKSLLVLPLLFIVAISNSQITNKIDKVETLKIYNGKVEIGKIIITPTLKTKIFLIKSTQKKDTSGVYITTFYFGNNDNLPLFGVKMVLNFDYPVYSCSQAVGSGISSAWGLSENKKTYTYMASQVNRSPFSESIIMSFTIKSAEKIKTQILGIDGIL